MNGHRAVDRGFGSPEPWGPDRVTAWRVHGRACEWRGTACASLAAGSPEKPGGAMRRVGRESERPAGIMGSGGPEAAVVGRAGRVESVSVVERLSVVRGSEYARQRGL
ncbi:hypothetical protein SCWH03_11080 [Streptomyces pacificus]|uniref:Uncharacterized protein n=1 Tax=Streptomyces pacificus TaxID=2705029 RepID=A0A6A0ASL6_9ACTN|nr:hypothetical protein SCWH03_11080 [Streptomyces pacificus]